MPGKRANKGKFKGPGQEKAHVNMAAGNLIRALERTNTLTSEMIATEAQRNHVTPEKVWQALRERKIIK
ncbi:hypothetical protein KKE06_00315 [Candidatus Micrarchaeota archaeon]|nr:hypothetical protein [Candidatus Micrarchaeota archaeon]MBU1930489.1 hypothetical protein [Candidatus Micrarchaeota archaeon]